MTTYIRSFDVASVSDQLSRGTYVLSTPCEPNQLLLYITRTFVLVNTSQILTILRIGTLKTGLMLTKEQ